MLKINRTSTFAWNLDNLPLLATGTVAGAVNANFDSSSTLELWDIFSATNKNEPIFSAEVETRFYALAWSKPFEGKSKGLLAGAFENGTIEFWDIAKLIKTKNLKKASVHKSTKHTGPVRSLLFNPNQPHILVSGGSKGEIFVWDTKTFSEPTSPGQAMTPMDEVTSVAWNNSVSHIFASTSNSGYTSIWDLKSKREVLHLSYTGPTGRANFSHVAWHPTQSTKLVTASDNDSCPLILTWDLRNSNAPEVILEGHKKGVLSLDWCKQDPELLISSGKDNSTLLWNPIKGLKLGEYPTTANWAFQTRFAPAAPDVFATASFDGKITIQSLQDTSPPVANKVADRDDNEFWNEISTTDTQKPVFDIKQAPKWLVRPSSVSFGFGSKLVRVSKDADGKSVVKIDKFISRKDLSSDKLTNALNSNDFSELINSKLDKKFVTSNDESDWNLLKKLSEEGNEKLLKQHLIVEEGVEKASEIKTDEKSETDFFENLGHDNSHESFVPEGSFSIYNDESSDLDKRIIQLILKNNIDGAVDQCLKNNRFNEASILALNASEAIKEKVRNSFFKNHKDDTLARVIYNISSKNVTDLTANADVSNWKEIALGISSFAVDKNEFNNKITELGDRLLKESKSDSKRQDAIACYIAGKSLDKVSNIWLDELPAYEEELTKSGDESISSPSDARFEALNNLVEKIVTYRGLSKITGELSGSAIESIAKAILEYSNLLAGYGKFELADKFLQLLPSDIAGSEKERINKASAKQVKASITKPASQNTATKRPAALPKTSLPKPVYPTAMPSTTPPAIPTPGQPFVPTSSTDAFAATRTPSVPATRSTNPYARAVSSNPYAPKQPVNSYNDSPIAPPPVAPSMPPPANGSSAEKTPFKYDVEGWNDLPNTFKPKANAARRAAPVASTPSPAPLPQANLNNPVQRTSSSNILPPPPKGVSRTSSKTSVPIQLVASPNLAHSQINSRYAPPPNAVQPLSQPQTPLMSNGPQGLGLSSGPSTPAAPPKNPYAPPPSAQPVSSQRTSFAVPPTHQQIGTPLQSPPVTSAPPVKNPYAPQQAFSPRMPSAGMAPPPPTAGIAPPPTAGIAPPPTAGMVPPPSSGFVPPPTAGMAPPQTSGLAPPPTASIAPPPAGGIVSPNGHISLPAPTPSEVKQKYPEGDRSHIPESSLPIYTSLTSVLEEIRPKIPERYSKHAEDMEKRLSFLFDHLNNSDLLSPEAINALKDVCNALEQRDFQTASALNIEIATKFSDEIGNWHTGVKRLITMAEAMY